MADRDVSHIHAVLKVFNRRLPTTGSMDIPYSRNYLYKQSTPPFRHALALLNHYTLDQSTTLAFKLTSTMVVYPQRLVAHLYRCDGRIAS